MLGALARARRNTQLGNGVTLNTRFEGVLSVLPGKRRLLLHSSDRFGPRLVPHTWYHILDVTCLVSHVWWDVGAYWSSLESDVLLRPAEVSPCLKKGIVADMPE